MATTADRFGGMKPDLVAEVTLDASETRPRLPGYRCPCIPVEGIDRKPVHGFDALLLLTEPLNPGETRTVGFRFLTPAGAEAIREAGSFYLWEGRVMGEAMVVPGPEHDVEEAPAAEGAGPSR